VRAYSEAVREGLRHCTIIDKRLAYKRSLLCDYGDVGKVQYLLSREGIVTLDSRFEDRVELIVLVPAEESESFVKQLTETTAGHVRQEDLGETYFAVTEDGEVLLFEAG